MGKTAVTDGNGVRADDPRIKRIFIVGGGGFGREVLNWIRDASPRAFAKVTGFLSADLDRLEGHACPLPIVANPDDFQPHDDCAFVLAIGIPYVRRRIAESLLSRGAAFLTVVHPTAIIAPNAQVGEGCVICPYAIVSDAARIGRFALLNYHSSLGHDAAVGNFAVLSPYATLGGGAFIGDEVFLGLHAAVSPGKNIGVRSKVSANTCASHHALPDSLIYGVPCRMRPMVDVTAGSLPKEQSP